MFLLQLSNHLVHLFKSRSFFPSSVSASHLVPVTSAFLCIRTFAFFFSPLLGTIVDRTTFENLCTQSIPPPCCSIQWRHPGASTSQNIWVQRQYTWRMHSLSSAAPGSSDTCCRWPPSWPLTCRFSTCRRCKQKEKANRRWVITVMGHSWKPDMGRVRLERAVKWKHCHYYNLRPSRPGPHAVNWTPRRGRREGGPNMRQSQMDRLQVEKKRAQWLCLNWSKQDLLLLRSGSPRINVKSRWLRELMASWWK